MKTSESYTLFCKCFPNTCLCFKVGGVGEKLHSEVERLLTRLIMGTNLPVVTLFNDMLLGSAPCWGCDSSPAGAAWWIAAGSWWCNHSQAVTATAPPDTCPCGQAAPPTGRHEGSTDEEHTGALPRPCTFLCRAFLSTLGIMIFFPQLTQVPPTPEASHFLPHTQSSSGFIVAGPNRRPSKAFKSECRFPEDLKIREIGFFSRKRENHILPYFSIFNNCIRGVKLCWVLLEWCHVDLDYYAGNSLSVGSVLSSLYVQYLTQNCSKNGYMKFVPERTKYYKWICLSRDSFTQPFYSSLILISWSLNWSLLHKVTPNAKLNSCTLQHECLL